MDADKIGKTIAFLRKKYGYTQRNLADRLGVTDKAVSRWERGLGVPDTSMLTTLSQILDVDIESVLAGNMSHDDLKWEGVLLLDYPDGIHADTIVYDRTAVELQFSLFLLVGIRSVKIMGDSQNIDAAERIFGAGGKFGIGIVYNLKASDEDMHEDANTFIWDMNKGGTGVMMISGLDFIYGKDVTRTLRRIMYDSRGVCRVRNHEGKSISIIFHPAFSDILDDSEKKSADTMLERGIIAFPIRNHNDIYDAGSIIKALEQHQSGKILDVGDIANNRGLVL